MQNKLVIDIPEAPLNPERTSQEYVYGRIHHAIMIGRIPPGTALTLRGLAEAMGLSLTPVREAIRRLSSENAVQINKNRRIVIPDMTPERFEELVALRITLETHAAMRSLPHVSDIRIDKMTVIDEDMDTAITTSNLDRLMVLNQSFHHTLYTINPSQVTMPVVESIWLQLGPFHRQILELLDEFYAVDRHKEILAALKYRDGAALVEAIECDIREGIWQAGRQLLATEFSTA